MTYLKGTVLDKNHWESYQADFYVEVGGLPARAAEGLRIPVWSPVSDLPWSKVIYLGKFCWIHFLQCIPQLIETKIQATQSGLGC